MAKEKAFFRRKGDKLDYKCTADGTVTATQGSNTYLGIAWSPAPATAGATVDVKINAGADVAAAAAASEGTE